MSDEATRQQAVFDQLRRRDEAAADAKMYDDLKGGDLLIFVNGGPAYVKCKLGRFNIKNVKNISVLDDDGADLWAFSLDGGGGDNAAAAATNKSKASPIKAVRTLLRSANDVDTSPKIGPVPTSPDAKKEGALSKALKGMKLALSPAPKARNLQSATSGES